MVINERIAIGHHGQPTIKVKFIRVSGGHIN